MVEDVRRPLEDNVHYPNWRLAAIQFTFDKYSSKRDEFVLENTTKMANKTWERRDSNIVAQQKVQAAAVVVSCRFVFK